MMENILEYNVLVIGAGMAGLSAGALATERGKSVLVVEKADEIGGSAQYAGFLWTVPEERVLRGWDDGDPHLGRVVVKNFPAGVQWMRERDLLLSGPQKVLHGYGYHFNVVEHLRDCARKIRNNNGHVITGASVEKLIVEDNKVTGAYIIHEGEKVEVRADAVIIATGGYQGNPEMRAERIHPNARNIPLRSNKESVGEGIKLGLEAGGTWSGENPGFYGHLVSSPANLTDTTLFVRLSQYHSDYSLLFNEQGKRFVDESQGDFRSSNMTVFESNARGLLVWDEYIHRNFIMKPFVEGVDPEDRLDIALKHGALGKKVQTLDEIAEVVTEWGFNGNEVVKNIKDYNYKIKNCPEQLMPPRSYFRREINEAPYYVLVVEPAITFTHGGLKIDEHARVLNKEGNPIEGLFAAGADAGNIYNCGYAGGLALALTFAMAAVETIDAMLTMKNV